MFTLILFLLSIIVNAMPIDIGAKAPLSFIIFIAMCFTGYFDIKDSINKRKDK